jgi:hypothetical protein
MTLVVLVVFSCGSGGRSVGRPRSRDEKARFLIGLVYRAATDDRAEDARLGELSGRNFGEVV